MNNNILNQKTSLGTKVKFGGNYTKEELGKITQWYDKGPSKQVEDQSIIKATIIEILGKDVVLDTGFKFDGTIPLTEFKDLPELKVGDEVEVYVEASDRKNRGIVLSRKKLKAVKGWQNIEKGLINQTPLEATVKRTSPGGLIASIQDIEVFLPGSQIDIRPVKDYEAFVNTTIQVLVIKINHSKKNVIVSRRAIIKKELEGQKRDIIEKLEEGQILEGVVKNIEKYGAFIDLGGITGLVHVKDMSWYKKISRPDKVKDAQGNLMFEKNKKIKVVVTSFDKEKNHVSLATKPLLLNPWKNLDKEIQEGSIIKCKVVKIIDFGIIVETSQGIEAFMHISDMSHSIHPQPPREIVKIDQELEVTVLHIDSEKQTLKVGIKQLIPNPWQAKDFAVKYRLDTRHKARVIKITDHGAFLELAKGIEGFLHNRHLSWTTKSASANKILKKNEQYEILIIGIDESKKMLELGFRELKESPWDDFQKIFTPGSTHKGLILHKLSQGFIIKLDNGPEVFVHNKDLDKSEKTELVTGKKLDFIVIDFIRYEEKIHISHNALFDTSTEITRPKKRTTPINLITTKKTTLRDIALVDQIEKKDEKNK